MLITANGAPNSSGWATEIGESVPLELLLLEEKLRAEWRFVLRWWRAGHRWKARAAGEGLGSSWWAAQGTSPSGGLPPAPSYGYNPYFSCSAGCKSKFGRHKGEETEMILMFYPTCFDKILSGPCLEGVLCTAIGAHRMKGYINPPADEGKPDSINWQLCMFCQQTTQKYILINFFSYKGHLNDIWLSKQDILWGPHISPHCCVCFSCFSIWH